MISRGVTDNNSVALDRHTALECRLGHFQDADFADDLADSKSTSSAGPLQSRQLFHTAALEAEIHGNRCIRAQPNEIKEVTEAKKNMTDSVNFDSPNAHISSQQASLFIFEGSDAVIKMIIGPASSSKFHKTWILMCSGQMVEGWRIQSIPIEYWFDRRTSQTHGSMS